MTAGWVFESAAKAEAALVAHTGQAGLERTVTRELLAGDLADGLLRYAPAVVELLGTGEAVAVPVHGRVLSLSGGLDGARWSEVRLLWEGPALAAERELFAQLPIAAGAAEKVIASRVARRPVARLIQFATSPGAPMMRQLSAAHWWARLAAAASAHALAYAVGLAGWAVIGRAALNGRWDPGWFWGWVIALAILIPLEASASWWQGWLAVSFGGLLKQRLLAGSLAIDTDKVRHQGVGQLLSRVLESDALENMSLTGGAAALLASIELVAAAIVLSWGLARFVTLPLLGAWLAVLVFAAWRYAKLRGRWMRQRNELTHALVENMNGHRTRIAQQPPGMWHQQEDRELLKYLRISGSMDRWNAWLTAVGPRGWLAIGMAGVGLEFIRGNGNATAAAIATGGVLLAYQALRRFVFGLGQCAAAWQAWDVIRDLFDAAAVSGEGVESPILPSGIVMEARDVVYGYPGRARNVLEDCSLAIRAGDRVLLEGLSGSGKSTFGAVLAGLRRQSSGLLLAAGVDLPTAGAQGWRRRVATAPQYHENHVLAAPLLFNLLMGRAWPPSADDAREAGAVCQELGLGPLLGRMPAGLMEMVGDTGWQLSQGERSRVYLARAILQDAPLMILDESFAALDPETLEQCLECVLRRAPSLLVIAHP